MSKTASVRFTEDTKGNWRSENVRDERMAPKHPGGKRRKRAVYPSSILYPHKSETVKHGVLYPSKSATVKQLSAQIKKLLKPGQFVYIER